MKAKKHEEVSQSSAEEQGLQFGYCIEQYIK